jgi:hypothetical protein
VLLASVHIVRPWAGLRERENRYVCDVALYVLMKLKQLLAVNLLYGCGQ